MNSHLILNIPHASTYLPPDAIPKPEWVLKSRSYVIQGMGGKFAIFNKVREYFKKELLFMTDWYTDELFSNGIGRALVFPASRLICDVERFRDPEQEPMEKIGMGICYSKKHNLEFLANPSEEHRQYILERYYDVYHRMLSYYVSETLNEHGRALILDCHSFSPVPLPYEPDQNPDRPDICLGTDSFHTPEWLVNESVSFFENKGYSVRINSPYSGTMVPVFQYKWNERVESIMIELNRGLYLKEGTNEKNDYFPVLKQHIAEFQRNV